jgi:hypothetical protein
MLGAQLLFSLNIKKIVNDQNYTLFSLFSKYNKLK